MSVCAARQLGTMQFACGLLAGSKYISHQAFAVVFIRWKHANHLPLPFLSSVVDCTVLSVPSSARITVPVPCTASVPEVGRLFRPTLTRVGLCYLTMRFSTSTAAAALALACSAAPTSGGYNLHEKRDGQPHAWQKRHRAVADHVLPIRIALKQRNLENSASYIYDVADPSSPNFGKPGLGTRDSGTLDA